MRQEARVQTAQWSQPNGAYLMRPPSLLVAHGDWPRRWLVLALVLVLVLVLALARVTRGSMV